VDIMPEAPSKQIRVLHLVGTGGVPSTLQQSLFLPLVTRLPRQRVQSQVITLSPSVSASLRQSAVHVQELALSSQRFAIGAIFDLKRLIRNARPDVIHAWGHTAQLISLIARSQAPQRPKLLWTCGETAPLSKEPTMLEQRKLQLVLKYAPKADRLLFASEISASLYRQSGLHHEHSGVIAPGIDAQRFKPDHAQRRRVRSQFGFNDKSFVIGMVAPFQPDYDHTTFLIGVGEFMKTNPHAHVLLVGHGIQRGNAPLVTQLGTGALATRTQLLGEWADIAALYNACDVVCSTARTDVSRMQLVMAMLCGVPCVATGVGAQGEVIGKFGVSIDTANPTSLTRGLARVHDMPTERRLFTIQAARKRAIDLFMQARTAQSYLQAYFDLLGVSADAGAEVPLPMIDPTIPPPPTEVVPDQQVEAERARAQVAAAWTDPESLETHRASTAPAALRDDDVLQLFEPNSATPRKDERARGVAEMDEDLLAPEAMHTQAVRK
jgi:glycosyltransferase involved in cell wall biosynthesis